MTEAGENVKQFSNLVAELALAPSFERITHASVHVRIEKRLADLAESALSCRDLQEDVDTILVLLDYATAPADLAFDPLEPRQASASSPSPTAWDTPYRYMVITSSSFSRRGGRGS